MTGAWQTSATQWPLPIRPIQAPRIAPGPPIRCLGVIGDVHGEAQRLEMAIAELRSAGADTLACTGDITDGIGEVDRCCDLLQDHQVITVGGNHDRWCIDGELRNRAECTLFDHLSPRSQAFLQALPTQVEISTIAGTALLCHGLGHNDMGKLMPQDSAEKMRADPNLKALLQNHDYRYLINGHSHYRMVRQIEGLTIINGGTIRRGHQPGFLLVDFSQGLIMPYDLLPDSPPIIEEHIAAPPMDIEVMAQHLAEDRSPAPTPVAKAPMLLPHTCPLNQPELEAEWQPTLQCQLQHLG